MAYATKAQIQTLLGSTFTIPAAYTANNDAVLNASIARAQSKIDAYTGNTWESIERILYLQGDGTDTLCLTQVTQWPARSIESIYYRYDLTDDFTELIDATSYMLSNSLRHITKIGYSSTVSRRLGLGSEVWVKSNGRNYMVTALFGTLTTPNIITEATVLLVRNEITPGHVDEWLPMYSERFADGYSYTRAAGAGRAENKVGRGAITTGHSFVDAILASKVSILPIAIVGV